MLTKDNFLLCAMHSYDNVSCKTLDQFYEDIQTLKRISKQLKKDQISQEELQETINLIMRVFNVFEHSFAVESLFFKVDRSYWNKLKPILIFLNRMPPNEDEIPLCQNIINLLRKMEVQ